MAHLTEILRPSGNVNSLWTTNAYTNLTDVIQYPTPSGDQSYIEALDADDNEIQQYIMYPPSGNYSSISTLSFFKNQRVAVGSLTMDTSIEVSGNIMPVASDVLVAVKFQWWKTDYTLAGSPTISDLTAIKLRFDSGTVGKSNKPHVDVAYILVSGVLDESGGAEPKTPTFPVVTSSIFESPVIIGL